MRTAFGAQVVFEMILAMYRDDFYLAASGTFPYFVLERVHFLVVQLCLRQVLCTFLFGQQYLRVSALRAYRRDVLQMLALDAIVDIEWYQRYREEEHQNTCHQLWRPCFFLTVFLLLSGLALHLLVPPPCQQQHQYKADSEIADGTVVHFRFYGFPAQQQFSAVLILHQLFLDIHTDMQHTFVIIVLRQVFEVLIQDMSAPSVGQLVGYTVTGDDLYVAAIP